MKNRHYIDDPNLPELPLFKEGGTREEQVRDMVGFVNGVRATSLDAYRDLQESGVLGNQELAIYKILIGKPSMTLQEISREAEIQINAVSGRVNGMKKKGYLVEAEKRVCTVTGRCVIPVKTNV
ncbi:MAG: hypothetical protein CMC15_13315 [Flavobacteriaceae bacterium]|mgnify:CR=1 FL=1|nr:hypothetical protein [Flavobacteriaceae bacterium]|tara:strand:+ start:4595 stop:4966 length:372 start_codon:yes stop_codon:yes gene_type:complete